MNVPNIKDLLHKLSFLRNNIGLLVPIIIVVVAGVLLVPTRMISARLRNQIETESVAKGRRIATLIKDAVPGDTIKQEEDYQKAYESDVNQIELVASQTTKRELLSYKIFPKPVDTSTLIFEEFGQKFRSGVEILLSGMGAGESPTDRELETALEKASGRSRPGRTSAYSPYPSPSPYTPYPTMPEGPGRLGRLTMGYGTTGEIEKKIIDEICRDKAKTAAVYAVATDITGYDFWAGYKFDAGLELALKDCWYWQLGYWIIGDVVDTVKSMNAGSSSIFTSPVKRLTSVNFDLVRKGTIGRARRAGMMARGKKDGGTPSYVTGVKTALTMPCTARFSTDEAGIDVVHFNMVVVVKANAVLQFMKELCSAKEQKFRGFSGRDPEQTFRHNQITILESTISPVDRQSRMHDYYRYGEDAVVELDLVCEYIFNKAGYDEIKPEQVKTDLTAGAEDQKGKR